MVTIPTLVFVQPEFQFEWYEYIVFGVILASSMGIGIFYGFFGNKNKTNEEFLMAGRSMGVFPVTMSLICTAVSAVSLLGNPVETYFYGTQSLMITVAFIPLTLLLIFIYVPVYFRLRLVSAMEYLEMRFNRELRVLCSGLTIFYLLIYMPLTVFAPSLALDHVAGIPLYPTCAVIFIVCIGYSSLGGLKAVLWTDALQGLVMLTALLGIIITGIIEVGGFDEIFRRSSESNRINFFNMDVDPRTRHTFWTNVIGGVAFWIPVFAASQAQVQRFNSVPNLRTARITLILNMVGFIIITVLTTCIGMILYAKYYDCDPITAEMIDSSDQLLPFFVMDVLAKYPSLPGLLVGGLTCGTLSTVSSCLNGLAASITEDFVKVYYPQMSDERLTIVSKAISAIGGIIAFGFVFPIAIINESFPMMSLLNVLAGSLTAPVFAAFTLGMFFPWANEIGTILGFVISVAVGMTLGLSQMLAGMTPGKLPDQRLYLTTEGCEVVNGTAIVDLIDPSDYVNPWKERDDSWDIQILSVSSFWLPGIGIGLTIFLGLIFSAIVNVIRKERKLVESRLFAYPVLALWRKIFGQKYLEKWIVFSDDTEEETHKTPRKIEELEHKF